MAARKPGAGAHPGVRGPGDRVVAAAGVRQPEAGAAADRPARLRVLRAGGAARGVAAAGCVRGRRGQVGRPAGPADRGAAVGTGTGDRADRAGAGRRPARAPDRTWPRSWTTPTSRSGRAWPPTRGADQGRQAVAGPAGGGARRRRASRRCTTRWPAMLPRIDYPELLLEVHGHTGMFDAIAHISGSQVRRDDLDISLAALLVARSCNIGLIPVAKPGTPALTEQPADRGGEGLLPRRGHRGGLGAAWSAAQARIGITADWGGGLVASADGMRFVVPVRSLYARPSPLYFGRRQAAAGGDLAEHGLGQGDGARRAGGARHAAGLRCTSWTPSTAWTPPSTPRSSPPTRAATATSCTGCSRSAATSSRRGTPTSPTPSCGGSTPPCWTAACPGPAGRLNGWGDFNTLQLRRVSLPAIVSAVGRHGAGRRVAGHRPGPRLRPDPHDDRRRPPHRPGQRVRRTTAGSSRPCTCCRSSTWRTTGG